MRAVVKPAVTMPAIKSASMKLLSIITAAVIAVSPAIAGPALLFDPANGRVLYAEDQDDQWFPASLTKIMTAYLSFEAIRDGKLKLDDEIGVSELAHSQEPSRIGLPVGSKITVEKALQALIVVSANDAAVMLGEAIAGSQDAFAERMNATAKRLGMTRTNFVNANGLPAAWQVTTARDLARLVAAMVRDFPAYEHWWSMTEVRVGKRLLRHHNPLLNTYDGADGMKTGFICDAGYNLIASASRNGQKLVAVVLGETTGGARSARAANLLEHGFQTVAWKAMLGTESLDSLPPAANPRGAVSIRQAVISWVCGNGPRRVAKHKGKRRAAPAKTKAASTAKAKAKTAAKKPAVKAQ